MPNFKFSLVWLYQFKLQLTKKHPLANKNRALKSFLLHFTSKNKCTTDSFFTAFIGRKFIDKNRCRKNKIERERQRMIERKRQRERDTYKEIKRDGERDLQKYFEGKKGYSTKKCMKI